MTISKYHGAGNSFVILEDFDKVFLPELVPKICIEHSVDGLILARLSALADFEMVYFNADGSHPAMCGNGLRCFVRFLRDQGVLKSSYQVEVSGKVLTVKCEGEKILTFHPLPRILFWEIELLSKTVYVVDSGVPHVVVFAKEPLDVLQEGGAMRHHEKLKPDGANVNFVTLKDGKLFVRTFERGVENETLACGTGVIASAFVANRLGHATDAVDVVTRSGEVLSVKIGDEVELLGPTEKV
ncbi:MAG: diaminopimelate epimerase [Simkaniaceae bacterium]|nr:diaminopimelate epimerase [Candidatus Sacchlamyda saccharinae]